KNAEIKPIVIMNATATPPELINEEIVFPVVDTICNIACGSEPGPDVPTAAQDQFQAKIFQVIIIEILRKKKYRSIPIELAICIIEAITLKAEDFESPVSDEILRSRECVKRMANEGGTGINIE
ncbi:hypothetical protein KKF03_02825, partial [Patescibacteria group bacterium]|nr:hypothetical protein [Patescibacteria group bacterium]